MPFSRLAVETCPLPKRDTDLKYEIGIFGGSSGSENCPDLTYQGNGLKIWASWELTTQVTTKPTFQGATIAINSQHACLS